jgi:hypothetical protein
MGRRTVGVEKLAPNVATMPARERLLCLVLIAEQSLARAGF